MALWVLGQNGCCMEIWYWDIWTCGNTMVERHDLRLHCSDAEFGALFLFTQFVLCTSYSTAATWDYLASRYCGERIWLVSRSFLYCFPSGHVKYSSFFLFWRRAWVYSGYWQLSPAGPVFVKCCSVFFSSCRRQQYVGVVCMPSFCERKALRCCAHLPWGTSN